MTNSVDITIIGGGLVGLTAAIALAGGEGIYSLLPCKEHPLSPPGERVRVRGE